MDFINTHYQLETLDLIIILIYFIAVLIHGYFAGRGKGGVDEYFLAGRTLPWFLIGFSLYSSNMSGASFIGLIGASYANGVVVFNYEWTATVVLIFFAFFMAPYFIRSQISTLPEFLETRFDNRSRTAFSLFTILAIIFIDTAGALYAGGIVVVMAFPDLVLWQAVAIVGLVAGAYTILGGLKAVVVTDTVQGILLFSGGAIIFFVGLHDAGGWHLLMNDIDEGKLRMIKGFHNDFLPWPGIFGVILLGFYYWTLNQFIVQRTLGARTLDHARKGALFAGLLKLPNLFIMIIPGLLAIILFPHLKKPDLAFPKLALELLPVGLKGLVMTALIAAIMSSMDSALNAAASLVTLDFVRKLKPSMSEKNLVRTGQLSTGIIMVISIIYAPLIGGFETLFEYFQSALAYVIPAIVAVYLIGIFWKRMTAKASFYTILLSLILGIPLFLFKEVYGIWDAAGLPKIHYTYMAGLIFITACLTIKIISFLDKAPEKEKTQYTYTKAYRFGVPERTPIYKDFRFQALFLLAMTVVFIFWW